MVVTFVAAVVEIVVVDATKPEPIFKSNLGCGSEAALRTGKDLILATKVFARENRTHSWWVVISTLALLCLTLTGTLTPWFWPARLICSVLSSLLMVRIFVIFHDHQHHTILNGSCLADFLMRLIGIFMLTPSSIWKSSHNYHHNHNSKLRSARIGSYPIMTLNHYKEANFCARFQYRFMRHPMTMLCGYFFVFFLGMSAVPFIEDPRKHLHGLLACVLHIALAITLFIFGGFAALFFTLLLPYFLSMAFGSYLFYVQHNFPDVVFRDSEGWTYEGAALDSSSFLKMPRIMHWFTANIGYHHIHHLNSKIPFYRLPEVMHAMPELQNPKCSSLHPFEIWKCLRLTVWDVEVQRMTPLPQ